MPTKQILNLGRAGIIKDIPSILLPENAFTDGRNVRFNNESVETITGEAMYQVIGTPSTIEYGMHWRKPSIGYNIYFKDGYIVRVDSVGNTSSPLLNSSDLKYDNSVWHTTYFNGGYAVVFNNSKSTPLYMLHGDLVAGTEPQELPGWNYITGMEITAEVIKPLGYSLVAANLTINDNGTIVNAPSTIRISVQAATGQFPTVWQPGLTTDTADEFEINSTSPILDMGELRGNMYIYSSDSIHVLSINNGTRLQPYAKGNGILSQGCFAEFEGKHFVVDRNDIYIHSGSGGIESVANTRIKDYFFNNLNKSKSDKVIVKKNSKAGEIWVCYPKGSNSLCNEALIYNYKNNTWTIRDLPNIVSIFETYSTSNGFAYSDERLVMLNNSNYSFVVDEGYQMWDGYDFVNYESFVAREKLNSGDTLGSLFMSSITPIFDKVPLDSSINITVTSQNNYVLDPDWSNTSGRDVFEFLPNNERNQGYKVDPRTSGRLLNYKISSDDYWRLALIGIDVYPSDRR
jgi:hypothetical protein